MLSWLVIATYLQLFEVMRKVADDSKFDQGLPNLHPVLGRQAANGVCTAALNMNFTLIRLSSAFEGSTDARDISHWTSRVKP